MRRFLASMSILILFATLGAAAEVQASTVSGQPAPGRSANFELIGLTRCSAGA